MTSREELLADRCIQAASLGSEMSVAGAADLLKEAAAALRLAATSPGDASVMREALEAIALAETSADVVDAMVWLENLEALAKRGDDVAQFGAAASIIRDLLALIQSAAHGGGTKSDGGVESRRHAETGNKSGAVPEAEQSSSATSFVRASGPEDKTLKPRAGVASGPSDPSHEPYEETPFAYAYEYPSYNGPVIRLGTYGREINGSKPIRAIPLYSRPVSLNREEITLAIINSIRKRHSLPAVEWSEIPKSDRTMWLQSGDAVLALIEGRK